MIAREPPKIVRKNIPFNNSTQVALEAQNGFQPYRPILNMKCNGRIVNAVGRTVSRSRVCVVIAWSKRRRIKRRFSLGLCEAVFWDFLDVGFGQRLFWENFRR